MCRKIWGENLAKLYLSKLNKSTFQSDNIMMLNNYSKERALIWYSCCQIVAQSIDIIGNTDKSTEIIVYASEHWQMFCVTVRILPWKLISARGSFVVNVWLCFDRWTEILYIWQPIPWMILIIIQNQTMSCSLLIWMRKEIQSSCVISWIWQNQSSHRNQLCSSEKPITISSCNTLGVINLCHGHVFCKQIINIDKQQDRFCYCRNSMSNFLYFVY